MNSTNGADCDIYSYEVIEATAKNILNRTKHRPKLAIVCGTGLGTLVDLVEDQEVIPYSSIPNFPQSTVVGHAGNLVFGVLSGRAVVLMQGRFHLYEGYSPQKCTLPIRVMKLLGVNTVFLTNACGGLTDHFNVGDFMIIRDHINLPGLAGFSPLRGPNDERFGPRFLALSDAYDGELRQLARDCAQRLGYGDLVHEGCYAMQMGPCYETIAECLLLKQIGADVIGMSTCPEVMVARHCSMRCFAISLITNKVILCYKTKETANHEEVIDVGKKSASIAREIVKDIVSRLPAD